MTDGHSIDVDAEREAARAPVTAERDALVEELRDRWDALASEMGDLLRRLCRNHAATRHAGIVGAEAIARGVATADMVTNGGSDTVHVPDLYRLGQIRLPKLDASTPLARSEFLA